MQLNGMLESVEILNPRKRPRNASSNGSKRRLEIPADEFVSTSEHASENAGNLFTDTKTKQMDRTPLRPIDRGQIPKTPFKQKNNETNENFAENLTILKNRARVDDSPSRSCEKTASENLKINFSGYLTIPSIEVRDENRRVKDEEESGNFNYQATVVVLHMYRNDEQLIHSRAEKFIKNIKPDPQFYDIDNGRKIYFMTKMCSKQIYQSPMADASARGKKKRNSYDNIECYVSHYSRHSEGPDCPLPEGTKLTKPHIKLVELVAKAIFDSPNRMLQVQQVYVALQNRYPYFRFMHKSAINSWKSSIRHALYQKWFYKVKILTGFHTDSKGCYWALNTSYTPREWEMPGQDKENDDVLPNPKTNYGNDKKIAISKQNFQIENCDEAIDLSLKRKLPIETPPPEPQTKPTKEMDPILPSVISRKAKRRLDMSSSADCGLAKSSISDKDLDLLGVAPLSPSRECVSSVPTYGISILPCNFGFWDENRVLFYPNPGAIEYYHPTTASISIENGIERVHQPCVWWENNYFDYGGQAYVNHDYSLV